MKCMRCFFVFVFVFSACSGGQAEQIDEKIIASNSISLGLDYTNSDFGFGVKFPEDFKVEYLENGVLLKKWIEPIPLKITGDDEEINVLDLNPSAYKLEIIVWPINHPETEEDLATYIGQKYPGYTIEARDYVGFSGFFVDESSKNLDALRHFFAMSVDKDIIYEAYVTFPSQYYDDHKDFFDTFVKDNLKIF